jgi:hypothetical protein
VARNEQFQQLVKDLAIQVVALKPLHDAARVKRVVVSTYQATSGVGVSGTRELIDVLLLHRSMTVADVIAGIAAALKVGAVSADVVALEARRHAAAAGGAGSGRQLAAHSVAAEHRVVSLTQRRLADPAAVIAGLPADTRPLPTLGAYDELLARRRTTADDPPTSRRPVKRATCHEPCRHLGDHHAAPRTRPDRTRHPGRHRPSLPATAPADDPGGAR